MPRHGVHILGRRIWITEKAPREQGVIKSPDPSDSGKDASNRKDTESVRATMLSLGRVRP